MNDAEGRLAATVVGVVLPVHDEEALLPAALEGLEAAIGALPSITTCRVAVVLDACRDGSAGIAQAWAARAGALVLRRECRSVGIARRAGSRALLDLWADVPRADIWLATTDADSQVPRDWLTVQLQAFHAGSDLWAGRVRLAEKSAVVRQWAAAYAAERRPIHGANLACSGALYERIGGFGRLSSGEDRDFHHRAVAAGFRVTYDERAVVTTSARRSGRAPSGFASVLVGVEGEQLGESA